MPLASRRSPVHPHPCASPYHTSPHSCSQNLLSIGDCDLYRRACCAKDRFGLFQLSEQERTERTELVLFDRCPSPLCPSAYWHGFCRRASRMLVNREDEGNKGATSLFSRLPPVPFHSQRVGELSAAWQIFHQTEIFLQHALVWYGEAFRLG